MSCWICTAPTRHERDLEFNDKRQETWRGFLDKAINKYKHQVFGISTPDVFGGSSCARIATAVGREMA